jgi:hypothetical protein
MWLAMPNLFIFCFICSAAHTIDWPKKLEVILNKVTIKIREVIDPDNGRIATSTPESRNAANRGFFMS